MSYTVIITQEDTANITVNETTQNITVDTSSFPITIEYNATTLTPNASPYGNAEVTALMAAFGANSISTTGNVTTGNVRGNGSGLTNITAGNVTGQVANALVAGTVYTAAQPNITSVGILTAVNTSGNISATGNITANVFSGTGSGLASLTGANVTGTVANATFALTANTATFANTATVANSANSVAGANVTGTVANATFALTANTATFANTATVANSANTVAGANVTGTVANATYALNANAATYATQATYADTANAVAGANVTGTVATANTVTNAAQANITSVGTLTSVSVTGNVTAGGVLTDNYRYANGTPVSFSGTYSDANVVSLMAAFGSNAISTSGNVTAGNVDAGNLRTTGAVSATGNVTGAYIFGNGSQLTGLPATYGNADVVSLLAAFGSNSISTTGNVTASYVIGNGSLLSNITGANVTGTVANAAFATTAGTAATANTAVTVTGAAQANITSVGVLTSLSVTGNTATGNLLTGGLVSATGNITGAAIFTTGNSTVGNLDLNNITSGNNGIQIIPDNGTLTANATGGQPGRVVFGNGLSGNLNGGAINIETVGATRLVVYDSVTLPQSQTNPTRVGALGSQFNIDLAGSSWTNKRATGYRSDLQLGNGAVTATAYNNIRAAAYNTIVGTYQDTNSVTQSAQANLATNTGLTHVTQIGGLCTVGNTTNFISLGATNTGTGNVGNLAIANTQIGFAGSSLWSGTGVATANTVIHFYGAGTTNAFGVPNMPTAARSAANYYFLRSDDPVAQVQLGSLRSYNQFNYVSPTTSGALTIDKVNAQVQQINLTGNITGITYANMVTSLSDGVNTDEELDTVTLIFNQGATGGFGVTFPTGATYKYSGAVTALTSTAANSVSVVTVRAVRIGGVATHLTTIEPAFV